MPGIIRRRCCCVHGCPRCDAGTTPRRITATASGIVLCTGLTYSGKPVTWAGDPNQTVELVQQTDVISEVQYCFYSAVVPGFYLELTGGGVTTQYAMEIFHHLRAAGPGLTFGIYRPVTSSGVSLHVFRQDASAAPGTDCMATYSQTNAISNCLSSGSGYYGHSGTIAYTPHP